MVLRDLFFTCTLLLPCALCIWPQRASPSRRSPLCYTKQPARPKGWTQIRGGGGEDPFLFLSSFVPLFLCICSFVNTDASHSKGGKFTLCRNQCGSAQLGHHTTPVGENPPPTSPPPLPPALHCSNYSLASPGF